MEFSQDYGAYPFQGDHGGILQLTSGNAGVKEDCVKQSESTNIDSKLDFTIRSDEEVTTKLLQSPEALKRQRHKRKPLRTLDGFAWYAGFRDGHWQFDRCEWNSPRYRKYRDDQRVKYIEQQQKSSTTDEKDKFEQIWWDEKEELFQYALRTVELLGRKKAKHGAAEDKLCGRNEHIALFIESQLPGSMHGKTKASTVISPRKQISSHLQTLKNKLKDNPLWLSLVTNDKSLQRRFPSPIDLTSGYPRPRKFNLPIRPSYGVVSLRKRATDLPPPPEVLGSNGIHRVNLEFCVNRRRSSERMHTYTRIQCETGAAPKCLDEIPNWRNSFPQLASYIDQQQFDGELVHCETSLDLGIEYPANSELAMITDVVIKEGVKYRDWTSVTSMYEQGYRVSGVRQGVTLDDSFRSLSYQDQKRSNETTVALKHNTKWWAHNVFAEVHRRVLQARDDLQATQEAIEWGKRFIENWSMIQELWSRPPGEGTELQRIAVFLWSFQSTRNGEAATTVWRKLTPPSPQVSIVSELQAPTSTNSQLSTVPETCIASATTSQYASLYNQSQTYNEQPRELLLMQPPNVTSGSGTPSPEYESSFPSSTSNSFPSSISSLDPALSGYQEAPLDVRDLTYLAEVSSFHAQTNGMPSGQQTTSSASCGVSLMDSNSQITAQYRNSSILTYNSRDQQRHSTEPKGFGRIEIESTASEQVVPYHLHNGSEPHLDQHQEQPQGIVCAETDIISPAYDHALTAQLANMLQRHELSDFQQPGYHLQELSGENYTEETMDDVRQLIHADQTRSFPSDQAADELTQQPDPYPMHSLATPYDYHHKPRPASSSYPTPHETDPYEEYDDIPVYSQQGSKHVGPQYDDHDLQELNKPTIQANHDVVHAYTQGTDVNTYTERINTNKYLEDTHNAVEPHYHVDSVTPNAGSAGSSFELVDPSMDHHPPHAARDYVMVTDPTTPTGPHWTEEHWTAIQNLDEAQMMEYVGLMDDAAALAGSQEERDVGQVLGEMEPEDMDYDTESAMEKV